jgi:hypothetical protein
MTCFIGRSVPAHVGAMLVALSLSACQHSPETSRLLGDGEVTVVGRIDIVPPLTEQELKAIGNSRAINRGSVFLSDRFVELNIHKMGAGRHAEVVDLGKHFVIKRRQFENLHYSGVFIGTKATPYSEQVRLPGNVVYKIRPEDKAIYIGTLRYHRDEYNGIKNVEYIDEYNDALKQFYKIQGDSKTPLRRVLPERPKS